MKVVSNKYKEVMGQIVRPTSQFQARLEMIDRSVESDATAITSHKAPFATSIFDKIHECDYLTFEQDYMKVGGNALIVPESDFLRNGYVSSVVTNSYGKFTEIPTLEFEFVSIKDFVGMTYEFAKAYPTEIRVTYYLDGKQVGQFISVPTGLEFVDEDNHIPDCNAVRFEFLGMSEPFRRLRISKMLFGLEKIFNTSDILSTDHTASVDPISSSLPYEKLTMKVTNYDKDYNPDNPHGMWEYFANGQPVRVRYGTTVDGATEWVDAAYLYISDAPTVDGKTATFMASDTISFLTNTYNRGLWRDEGISLYDLAIDVLHDAGVNSYSIPTYLQNIITYAPLPIATHRECLQLIANAGRCVLYSGKDGEVVMRLQLNADVSISDNGRYKWSSLKGIYNGGSKVDYITFEPNKWRVGTNGLYIPTEESTEYKNTGFISEEQSDGEGKFVSPPKLFVAYTLPVSSYQFSIGFDSVNETCASDFNILFTNGENLVKKVEVRGNTETVYMLNEEVIDYTLITIEIISTLRPYHRVRVESINEGKVTDFYLDFSTAMQSPTVNKSEELKCVDVTVHSYHISNEPTEIYKSTDVVIEGEKEIQVNYDASTDISATVNGGEIVSAIYYAETAFLTIRAEDSVDIIVTGKVLIDKQSIITTSVNRNGEPCPLDNPLVTDVVWAKELGEWVANYLKNRNSYETNFRQDFRLDTNDIIYIQSDFDENIPARITKLQYKLPGQQGAISVRRMT